jgi:UDPglucose 6-dehydrogenase
MLLSRRERCLGIPLRKANKGCYLLVCVLKLGVVGLGYVGIVSSLGFAELGFNVVGVDVDAARVESLSRGRPPVFEPGLEGYLKRNMDRAGGRGGGGVAVFTTDYTRLLGCDVVFITVGTPPREGGGQNLEYFEGAVKMLREVGFRGVVVPRSTVLPGTTERVVAPLFEHVGYNPEFLAEGSAFRDFFNPDKIVLGYSDGVALEALRKVYSSFNAPKLELGVREAELVKYANNAFLALKVAYADEVGNIAKKLGVDVYRVMDAVGLDRRIGRAFLNAGIGFGGSCFPKDLAALIHLSRDLGYEPVLLDAVLEQNRRQPLMLVDLLRTRVRERLGRPSLRGLRVGVLGLAFKPNTDDVREAPSIRVVSALLDEGVEVHAYDPRAEENFRRLSPRFSSDVVYHATAKECVEASEAVLILTEWEEFRDASLYEGRLVLEGRRVLGVEGVCW